MKRFLTFLFASMLVGQAWAQTTFTIDNLKYIVTNAAMREVSVGCENFNLAGDIVLQSSVDNEGVTYKVTSIRMCAFNYCPITSITIANTITRIEEKAFDCCTQLSAVTIPNSVTKIEKYAFNNCVGLTSITIPNSVSSIG